MAYSINSVQLLGRLTKDPYIGYTGDHTAQARFNLAIDNGKDSDGKDRQADFPSIVAWGKLGEYVEKTLAKGQRCFVSGKVKTGSYEKNGNTVWYTEILAQQVIPLDKPGATVQDGGSERGGEYQAKMTGIPSGFEEDPDIPF